jgi:putative membrane protein
VATPTLTDAASLRDGRWYRLHPLTPVLQGGVVVAGVVGFVVATLWESVVVRALLLASGAEPEDIAESDSFFRLIDWIISFAGIVVVAGIAAVGIIWLQWRLHVVRMDDDVIEVKKGVIFRSSRRARRDRVNTVGVRRPLIPRVLGLAKLDIQAAGSDANVVLAYLPHAIAQEVRREILAQAPSDNEADVVDTAHVKRVVDVPLFRYLASLVLSVETLVFAGALVFTVTAAIRAEELVAWLAVVIAVFVYVAYLADRFFRVGSFVVDTVDSDLRVSLGLLSTSVETIPPERIHALQLSQPWPWKLVGWWRVDANLASSPGAQVSKAPAHTVIVPVATLTEALTIVSLCIPALGSPADAEVISGAVSKKSTSWMSDHPQIAHSISSPVRARYRIPLSYRVNGGALIGDVVVLRTGVWVKKLSLVPLARTQSSGISVGPWHDALGLAACELHSVSGPVSTTLPALDAEEVNPWWDAISQASLAAIARSRPKTQRTRRVAS